MSAVTRVVVVQPHLEIGDVEANLIHVEDLVRSAVADHAPAIVVLPEDMGSPVDRSLSAERVVRPIDGAPLHLLRVLARKLDVVMAGGFLARRGGHTFSTYAVVEPDGRVHLHNATALNSEMSRYCTVGTGSGRAVLSTLDALPVGVVHGREWELQRTVDRLAGHAHVVLGSLNSGTSERRTVTEDSELPARMATLLDAPVVTAGRVWGPTVKRHNRSAARDYEQFGSGSRIVDRDGSILAHRSVADGEGYIAADIRLDRPEPTASTQSDGRWIDTPQSSVLRVRHAAQRATATAQYRGNHLAGRHPWQKWPGGDLPEHLSPGTGSDYAATVEQTSHPMKLGRAMANAGRHVRATLCKTTSGRIGHNIPGTRTVMLLFSTNARTGVLRTTGLSYGYDGERRVVTATAPDGVTPPRWLEDIRTSPYVKLQIDATTVPALARIIDTSDPGYRRLERLAAGKAAEESSQQPLVVFTPNPEGPWT